MVSYIQCYSRPKLRGHFRACAQYWANSIGLHSEWHALFQYSERSLAYGFLCVWICWVHCWKCYSLLPHSVHRVSSAGKCCGDLSTLVICRVFAILLGLFELRVKWTAPFIRKLFGFMFTYWGRTIFLILYDPTHCWPLDRGTQKLSCLQLRSPQFRSARR